jgi:HlyD family secretion protein
MRKHRMWLIAAAIVIAAVGLFAWHVTGGGLRPWFGKTSAPVSLELSGNIEAHESVLGFKDVQSRIVELPFDEGQWVKRGTLLARVEDADYRQQVAIAQAAVAAQERQLDVARSNRDAATRTLASDEADLRYKSLDDARLRRLSEKGFIAADTRDLADAALDQARAVLARDRALCQTAQSNLALAEANLHDAEEQLRLAQITLGYTALVAPIDGVILVRQAELGEIVSPGTPVVTLADLDHVWLRAYVNEPDIGRVRLGQAATVVTDNAGGKTFSGRVSFISDQAEFTPKSVETHAERVTLVYRIRIDIDNPTHELVPGMPADARLRLAAPP